MMAPYQTCTIILFYLFIAAQAKTYQKSTAKEELEKYIEEKKAEVNPRYRLHYHVAAPVGWINDPNGFSYYKGEYHLFYQFYPYATVWGPMHWGHVTSPDLVTWKQLPTALLPDEEQCFSGSAVVDDDDNMVLIYTGHKITETDPFFNQTQYLAFSDDGIDFHKYEGNPVLATAPNGADDFRDPKVWKHGDYWYVVLGSKTLDERGRVLLYRSDDLKSWEFLTVIAESTGELGYMWECPDFFELNGKYVLLISPQGIETQGDRFRNLYQTGYIVGDFNYDTFEFEPDSEFQEIDYGHDFYAAQTTEVEGKRYLIGWFGMWEEPHPEDADGWANAMTIVRELELKDNNLIISKPVEAITDLREEIVKDGYFDFDEVVKLNSAAELIVKADLNENINLLIQGDNGGDEVLLQWDPLIGKVVVNRNGDIRQMAWNPISSETWRIFLDASSLELFCGEGELVFSSRVYPDGGWRVSNLSQQSLVIQGYNLKRSVPA